MRKARPSIMPIETPRHGSRSWFGLVVWSCAVLMVLGRGAPEAAGKPADGRPAGAGNRSAERVPVAQRAPTARGSTRATARSGTVLPGDNMTLRPTVVVRRDHSQGSGTIIASVDGEALILTAAHVVKATGPIFVELHRYNLGRERMATTPGRWPRTFEASLAAADVGADLAILRIEKLGTLPYVARLAPDQGQLAANSVVNSVGIDLGAKLTIWTTRLVKTVWFELNESRTERLFLITTHTPEHGRSGGGLFLANGELIGVCVGHAALEGERRGVFASHESIRQLLDEHDQLSALVARSEERRNTRHSPDARSAAARPPASPVVAPVRAVAAALQMMDEP